MPGEIYGRTPDVAWRAGPDRVLLHRVGGPTETAAIELTGTLAFIWVALDEPSSMGELVERLTDAGLEMDATTRESFRADVHQLVAARLLIATASATAREIEPM